MELDIRNGFLRRHLEYVEDTETPRIMHIWAALSGISACLGRRCFYDHGIGHIFPNQYVFLVGPPGVKKSTAIDIVKKIIRDNTGVRFAPSDTGGQRQGLIKALVNDEEIEDEVDNELEAADIAKKMEAMEAHFVRIDERDKHVLYICEDELSSFIGTNAQELVKFLRQMWDGKAYEYRLRSEQLTLHDPLLNALAGTNPTDIADCLPQSAIGQGFTSRSILVYANKPYKDVPDPDKLNDHAEKKLAEVYKYCYYEAEGEFKFTEEARQHNVKIYKANTALSDNRFLYYLQRRQAHYFKLCMALTAADGRYIMGLSDLKEALNILAYTEVTMPEALGEYGMSPLGAAKQKLVEFLAQANTAVPSQILWASMQRDVQSFHQYQEILMELRAGGRVSEIQTKDGPGYVYNTPREAEIVNLYGHVLGEKE